VTAAVKCSPTLITKETTAKGKRLKICVSWKFASVLCKEKKLDFLAQEEFPLDRGPFNGAPFPVPNCAASWPQRANGVDPLCIL